MDCTLCLKPERQYDAHYRYKMPPLEAVADARNKQRKTHLPNVASVAKNIFRPEAWLVKYLALNNSTDSGGVGSDAYLTGHHSAEDLQVLTFAFIREYVLCKCGSPETLLHVQGKKRNKVCRLQCHSCGRSGKSAGQDDKMLNLFAAQPMPLGLCPMGSLGCTTSSSFGGAAQADAVIAALDVTDGVNTVPVCIAGGRPGVAAGARDDVQVCGKHEKREKHVTWDEATIAEHRKCAGVLYGTQRIEESLTPFLYYSESVSRGEGMIGELVPGSGVSKVSIEALQERLGVLAFAQSAGEEICPSATPAAGRPLPPAPWLFLQSRSEHGEFFYFNPSTREATWTLPAMEAGATEVEGASSSMPMAERVEVAAAACTPDASPPGCASSDDEEEVPLPSSKLAAAADCAADFAHRRRLARRVPSGTAADRVVDSD